ncbi:HNH endonuclease [Enterobacter hormaechei]|uniref:HNH endonuclease n=2 Tax=Enterobacter hormaechei TaxID=158836 RepID=UPI003525BEF3
MRPELNQEYLRSILTYDPESGHFKWNFNKGARNKSPYAGTLTSYGYIKILIDQKQYFAHRLAWLYVHGHWPEGFIDHINGDKADNRLINLREAKREENCRNVSLKSTNTSGYVGIFLDKRNGTWRAQITVSRKQIVLGYFHSKIEAVRAFNAGASLHHGDYAVRKIQHNEEMLMKEFGHL